MRTIASIFVLGAILATSSYASAQETNSRGDARATINDRAMNLRTQIATNTRDFMGTSTKLRLHASSTTDRFKGIGVDVRRVASSTRADFEAKREAIKADMSIKAKARGELYLKNIIERLGNAITRLESFMTRAETAIEKFAEKGANTTEAESLFAEAEVKVDAAVTKVEALAKLKVEANTADTTVTKEAAAKIRTATQEATQAVKEAHQSLVAVIASLNAGVRIEADADVNTQ